MVVFSVAHISKVHAWRPLKGLKKLDFGQLFLWASSSHILFARGHSLLVLVNREL